MGSFAAEEKGAEATTPNMGNLKKQSSFMRKASIQEDQDDRDFKEEMRRMQENIRKSHMQVMSGLIGEGMKSPDESSPSSFKMSAFDLEETGSIGTIGTGDPLENFLEMDSHSSHIIDPLDQCNDGEEW